MEELRRLEEEEAREAQEALANQMQVEAEEAEKV